MELEVSNTVSQGVDSVYVVFVVRPFKNIHINGMTLTPDEIRREWLVVKETRLGVFCGTAGPTPEQLSIAATEADDWRRRYEKQEKGELF